MRQSLAMLFLAVWIGPFLLRNPPRRISTYRVIPRIVLFARKKRKIREDVGILMESRMPDYFICFLNSTLCRTQFLLSADADFVHKIRIISLRIGIVAMMMMSRPSRACATG
jgi:hypothetical protein